MITWNINIGDLHNGEHIIETKEGAIRTGKITKVNWTGRNVLGNYLKEPETIELNNDASDFITWREIKSIRKR